MKSFEDSSLNSDTASTHNSMYSASSFSPPTPPPSSSTPTFTSPNFNMQSQPPIRPKTRTGLSLNAEEFVPSTPNSSFGYQTQSFPDKNEYNYITSVGNRNAGINPYQFPPNLQTSFNFNNPAHSQLLLQHQQIIQEKQQILQRQQELAAAAVARQKYFINATATAKNNSQNEIANSLKMLAFLSSPGKGNETPQFPVEEVMQEFASNGYTTDDYNRYQQAANSMQMLTNSNVFQNAANNTLQPPCYGQNLNALNNNGINMGWLYNPQQMLNDNLSVYNEILRQNFLQLLPQHLLRQAEVVNAAAAAINMDYNRQNKPFKKGYYKKDPQLAIRRCVFCENNKEPDAVVRSHAVRDSQGRVLCPKLRIYVCPICNASGDDAHTVKYCPQKPIVTMEDAIKAESERNYKNGGFSQAKSSHNMKV